MARRFDLSSLSFPSSSRHPSERDDVFPVCYRSVSEIVESIDDKGTLDSFGDPDTDEKESTASKRQPVRRPLAVPRSEDQHQQHFVPKARRR